jgi:hypothetical protein
MFGFLLPAVACCVTLLGLFVTGRVAGHWSSIGVFVSGVPGLLTLGGGIWLASRQGWRGAWLGFVIYAALTLLVYGVCYRVLGLGSR